ncbi:hypothetical protein [Tenacibaculum sp. nBUS_03]|uniref:hypothetical protein n=1 Tax=Tenacibaculum sp. nBUS_03 TaxID=3395320 RepID=UPI003EB7A7A9
MFLEKIKIGQEPDDGTGDTLREGAKKINAAIDQVNNGLKPFKIGELLEDIGEPIYRIHKGNHYRYIGVLPNTIRLSDVPGVSNIWRKVFFTELDRAIKSISISGDTTKVLKLIKEDGTVLQADFAIPSGGAGHPKDFYEEVDFTPRLYATQDDEYTANSSTGKLIRLGNIAHFYIKMIGISDPANINDTSRDNRGAYITGIPFLNDANLNLYTSSSSINHFVSTSIESGVDFFNLSTLLVGNRLLIIERGTSRRVTNISFGGGGDGDYLGIQGTFFTNVYTPQ